MRRTYETIKLDDLDIKSETDSHYVCHCPCCTNKRGRDYWSNNKLYWHKEKSCGYCHQCLTVFLLEVGEDEDISKYELSRVTDRFLTSTETVDQVPVDKVAFNFEDLDDDLKFFMHKRNPFLPILAEVLGIKAWYGSKKGVVLPFLVNNTIVKFQARFTIDRHTKNDNCYYTSRGHKYLYSPTHLFSHYNLGGGGVTLCEGVFDAIALTIMEYPNPVALLGKSITPIQITMLRKLLPQTIHLAMDDTEINAALEPILLQKIPSVETVKFCQFYKNHDPEEHMCRKLKFDKQFELRCFDFVTNWISSVKGYNYARS